MAMAVRREEALLVVFLRSVREGKRRVRGEWVSAYSREALPKTVEMPRSLMAGW